MNRLVMLFLAGGCVMASAQQATQETFIPVVDRSPSGSPIAVSGTFIVKDEPAELFRHSGEGKISLTNVSSKPVLLTVLQIHMEVVRAPDMDSRSDDNFFSNLLQPGSTDTVADSWRFGTASSEAESMPREERVTPGANVSMLFVQFADGSTWGDPTKAKTALEYRVNTVNRLMALESVYRADGENAFIDDLLKPTNLPAIWQLQDLCKHTEDKNKVLDLFFGVSHAADDHARGLRSTQGKE